MLKRKVYQELLKWKENTEGKALCIIGARQIGKTTLIREFGKNEYEHFAEINFVTDEKAADIFNDRLTAEAIITNLTAYLQTPLEPGKTLGIVGESGSGKSVFTKTFAGMLDSNGFIDNGKIISDGNKNIVVGFVINVDIIMAKLSMANVTVCGKGRNDIHKLGMQILFFVG